MRVEATVMDLARRADLRARDQVATLRPLRLHVRTTGDYLPTSHASRDLYSTCVRCGVWCVYRVRDGMACGIGPPSVPRPSESDLRVASVRLRRGSGRITIRGEIKI